MSVSSTKRFGKQFTREPKQQRVVRTRNVVPDFSEEEKAAIKQRVQDEKRILIPGVIEVAVNAAQCCVVFCRQANQINGEIGANKEAEVIIGNIFSETDKAVLLADNLPDIKRQMDTEEITIDDAYAIVCSARDYAIVHRDAAHEALEQLKELQKRLAVRMRAQCVVGDLVAFGVNADVAKELSRIDWGISAYAVRAARVIADGKDSKNLSYDSVVDAIEFVFGNKKDDLQKIISERKYYYEGGLPETNQIIKEIERRSGISFAAINDVPGDGLTHNLRRMKMLAIVNWLFYQPEYLWRFENNLAKVGGVDPAEVKAEA